MAERPIISLAAAFGAAAILLVAALIDLTPPDLPTALGVAAIAFACGRSTRPRAGVTGALAMLVALAASGDDIVPAILCTTVPWGAGRALRSQEQLLGSLREREREVEAEQEALVQLTVRHERARIARELHDIVAHHLAVIVIQAGAGRMATDEDGVGERCGVIRRSGEEALAEMSRLVALLQPDARGGEEEWALEPLLAHAQAAGLQVRSVELSDARLRPELGQLAYRIVQEGLTNAMKHAPGSKVRLRVAVEAGALEIDLHDDSGDAPGTLSGTGSGLGLEGLRERTESFGGTLDAGEAIEGGWRLRARIPAGEVTAGSPSKG